MTTNKMIIKLKIPEKAPFDCPICSKSFTTGKGLGGHKRVHMEKKNKRNHETMELQIEENGVKTLASSCPVCHQSFASEKSLHGHMRKHPDRGWRGMKPPPLPPVEAEAPPPDQEALSLANNLLALASCKKSKLVVGENSSLVINDDKGDSNKTNVKEEKKYLCDICGKLFRSYQALGGHKSHHGCKDDKSAPLYMEQPERYDRVVDHGQVPVNEEGNNGGTLSSLVLGFDLNELPPEMDDCGGHPNW